MITHDREIASHADRIVEIRDGVLREDHDADDEDFYEPGGGDAV